MLNIEKNTNASELTLTLIGRLDTDTAPELDAVIRQSLQGVTALTLDLAGLTYTSSAGLRVFLKTQKVMNRQGSMRLINVCEDIMEIFEMTGFTDLLTIE